MKRKLFSAVVALSLVGAAYAQNQDVTMETTTTRTMNGYDLLSDLWLIEDATPVPAGSLDLRLTGRWMTGPSVARNDDFILQPSLYWGAMEDVEVSLSVPVWVGDAGDASYFDEGNADTYVGVLWRFMGQEGNWPAMALSGTARVPTGTDSDSLDGELRLVMTNEYESGIRSHVNVWATTVNGDNLEFDFESPTPGDRGRDEVLFDTRPDPRNFRWGAAVGLDGPLCADGAVRWVADYTHTSSIYRGESNLHFLELGWEWQMAEAHRLGMSGTFNLDQSSDVDGPYFGVSVTYAYALMR